MNRYGLLAEGQNKLDYVLALTAENFLARRLQTLVFKAGMAKSIHHARVLIKQRHIRYAYLAACNKVLFGRVNLKIWFSVEGPDDKNMQVISQYSFYVQKKIISQYSFDTK